MKVVFFGTPDFVEPVIKVLDKNFELVKSIRNPKQLNHETIEQLKNLNIDLFVIASFGKILSKEFLEIPKFGSINIHPSLLPKYRGPTPVQTAILNGDKKTGVTIIKLDEEVDHGPILAQKEVEILENETSKSLLNRLFKIGAEMLPEIISNYIKEQIKISPQDHSKATFTQILNKQSGFIDMNNLPPTEILDKMTKAYLPWPGVWFKTNLNNKEQIIKLLPNQKIQVEGKKPMEYKDFINGYPEGRIILELLRI